MFTESTECMPLQYYSYGFRTLQFINKAYWDGLRSVEAVMHDISDKNNNRITNALKLTKNRVSSAKLNRC